MKTKSKSLTALFLLVLAAMLLPGLSRADSAPPVALQSVAPPEIIEQAVPLELVERIMATQSYSRIIGRISRREYDITTKAEIERFLQTVSADEAYQNIPDFQRETFSSKEFILLGKMLEWGGNRLAVGWYLRKYNLPGTATAEQFLHSPGEIYLIVVASDGIFTIKNSVLIPLSNMEFIEFFI